LQRKVRAEAAVAAGVVVERAQVSVLVAAVRAECPAAVARALVDLARVEEAQQDHQVKLAAFGKAAAVREPPEAD
jgi:hypothetical protein